ncbi:MAG: flippase-like domain-containing protein [Anaerolineales bacterium]|nr:flippase-like domain-containing protein [Anaerolineales bacterium]
MKKWQFWLGVAISAFFLYLVLKDIEFAVLWQETLKANYWLILPGVAAYFVGLWVRAWRWHYLLRPVKAVSTKAMFPIVAMGYAGNNIFPARAGEVLRAVVLKTKEGVPISASLATIIVERVYDGVVMLAFIFVNLAELSRLTEDIVLFRDFTIQDVALWGSVLFFGVLVVFLAAAMMPKFTLKVVRWLAERLVPERFRQKVMDIAVRFLDGLASLSSPVEALMVFLTSVVIWLLETVKYWFVMHAFRFVISFFALMLMNGVVNLATTIPSAPGYLGTFDLPGIKVLGAYGIPAELAASYTFVLHFALWFPVTAVGLYYMWREGIKWQKVTTLPDENDSQVVLE